MEYSPKGIPILTMREKLDALDYCIAQRAWEDAAGHLCDLLAHVGEQMSAYAPVPPSTDLHLPDVAYVPWSVVRLQQLVEHYGKEPTPIIEPQKAGEKYRSIDEPWGS